MFARRLQRGDHSVPLGGGGVEVHQHVEGAQRQCQDSRLGRDKVAGFLVNLIPVWIRCEPASSCILVLGALFDWSHPKSSGC